MKRFPLALLLLVTLLAPVAASAAERRAVARIWKGRTLAVKADEYEKYLNASGVAKILATPGNLGVQMLRRADGDKTEFVVISFWESIDAVKNFAGPDYQKAVILERDREYLLEVEPNVLHYEVVRQERR
jgi:heme-degrading monooxygenase HmoA